MHYTPSYNFCTVVLNVVHKLIGRNHSSNLNLSFNCSLEIVKVNYWNSTSLMDLIGAIRITTHSSTLINEVHEVNSYFRMHREVP